MILLTRPYTDSEALAGILGPEKCIIEPMIEIETLDIDISQHINNDPQAIVITSKNAPNINVWPITIRIPDNGKDADEILKYCKENFNPEAGKVVYLSGEPITLDIAEELSKDGFDTERVITYKQHPVNELSEGFINNIDKLTTATFFSMQTLNNFKQLVDKHNLNDKLLNIKCITLSKKIAVEAESMNWKEVQACSRPNQESMIRRVINPLLDT